MDSYAQVGAVFENGGTEARAKQAQEEQCILEAENNHDEPNNKGEQRFERSLFLWMGVV